MTSPHPEASKISDIDKPSLLESECKDCLRFILNSNRAMAVCKSLTSFLKDSTLDTKSCNNFGLCIPKNGKIIHNFLGDLSKCKANA